MDRRSFLKWAGAVAGIAAINPEEAAAKLLKKDISKDLGAPKLTIGIISDAHIYEDSDVERFKNALKFFKKQKVDGVILAGDIIDEGLECEFKSAIDAWNSVFKGTKVERLFVLGNHDIRKISDRMIKRFKNSGLDLEKELIRNRRDEVWEKYTGEKWEPIWVKEINGYKFVGAHYQNSNNVKGLDEFINGLDLKGDKPFFYIQHCHPKDTCSAPWTWGQDDGKVTKLLSNYPNCIAFSGHSHTSVTDDRTCWQGAFTSVGTGSLRYIIPFGGRENTKASHAKVKVPSQMKNIKFHNTHQGQIMKLYNDYMVLERYDMGNNELLLEPLVVPVPAKPENKFSFDDRAKTAKIPEFSDDAKVAVGEMFDGKDRFKVPQRQVPVSFPVALSTATTPHAFDYEVSIEIHDVDTYRTMITKRILSENFGMGDKGDCEKPVTILFGESELPTHYEYRYCVRPCECFGGKGRPIYSEWIVPEIVKKAFEKE